MESIYELKLSTFNYIWNSVDCISVTYAMPDHDTTFGFGQPEKLKGGVFRVQKKFAPVQNPVLTNTHLLIAVCFSLCDTAL